MQTNISTFSTQASSRKLKLSYAGELRRVPFTNSTSPDAMYKDLCSAATSLFDIRSDSILRFTYLDEDGDQITLTSGPELQLAIEFFETYGRVTYKFDIRLEGDPPVFQQVPGSVVHKNVTCDECCMSPICGVRYKCAVRRDFDLCSICEAKKPQPYPMLKIYSPDQAPASLIVMLNEGQFPGAATDGFAPPPRGRGWGPRGQGAYCGPRGGRRAVPENVVFPSTTKCPPELSSDDASSAPKPQSNFSEMPQKVAEVVSAAVGTVSDIASAMLDVAMDMTKSPPVVPTSPVSADEVLVWRITSGPSCKGSANWINKKGETMFHFSPRPGEACIVLNTWSNGCWGPEERIEIPDGSKAIEAEIKATHQGFEITFPGDSSPKYTYEHRLPWEDFLNTSKHPEWKVELVSRFRPSVPAPPAPELQHPAKAQEQQEQMATAGGSITGCDGSNKINGGACQSLLSQIDEQACRQDEQVAIYSTEIRILSDMGFVDISTVLPVLQATIITPVSRHPELHGKPKPEQIQQAVAVLLQTSLR